MTAFLFQIPFLRLLLPIYLFFHPFLNMKFSSLLLLVFKIKEAATPFHFYNLSINCNVKFLLGICEAFFSWGAWFVVFGFLSLSCLSTSQKLLDSRFERSTVMAVSEILLFLSLASTKSLFSLTMRKRQWHRFWTERLQFFLKNPFLLNNKTNAFQSRAISTYITIYQQNFSGLALTFLLFFLQFHFLPLTNLTEISFSWLFLPHLMVLYFSSRRFHLLIWWLAVFF